MANHNDLPTVPALSVQGYPIRSQQVPRRFQGLQFLAKWKNEESTDRWLRQLVGGAFQTFVVSCLPGQPAAEMLPLTAQQWVEVLLDMGLNEEQDLKRLNTAIRGLHRTIEEWPQVASLIKVLQPRETTSSDTTAQRVRTEDEETTAREALAEMKRKMRI